MDGADAFAAMLADQGWCHTPGLVDRDWCAGAIAAFREEVAPYDGPLLRQLTSREEAHQRSADGFVVNPVHNPHRLGERFPRFAALPGEVLGSTVIGELAAVALGEPVALLQAAFYESALGTEAHRDEHPLDPEAPMLGVWIALEDIAMEAGPLLLWPRSHRIEDGELAAASRASWTARFVEKAADPAADARVAERLGAHLAGVQPVAAPVPAGDVLWWWRDTVHGSLPPSVGAGRSRCSLVLHFVPQASLPAGGYTAPP